METTANTQNRQADECLIVSRARKLICVLNAASAKRCTCAGRRGGHEKWSLSKMSAKRALAETSSKFIKIRCPKCKNEQIMFGKASTIVNCLVCSRPLAEPSGGKSKVKARVLEVLE